MRVKRSGICKNKTTPSKLTHLDMESGIMHLHFLPPSLHPPQKKTNKKQTNKQPQTNKQNKQTSKNPLYINYFQLLTFQCADAARLTSVCVFSGWNAALP